MSASMKKMNDLLKRKDELESEIKALNEVLESQGGVGMTGALIDTEGYPRADIDIYSVRHARHDINCLQNDHTAVMQEIEEELYKIHAEARQHKQSTQAETQSKVTSMGTSEPQLPFALVETVSEGSPADVAGLRSGDAVLKFGSLTKDNFQSLQNLVSILQHSEGNSLPVVVRRSGEEIRLNLTPRKWSGSGLLGCKIKPEPKT